MAGRKPTTEERIHRFWLRVDVRGPDDCWIWKRGRTAAGYGQFGIAQRKGYAHRFSWIIANGPIPAGMHILHRCDNPPCVNPAHLLLGTHDENMKDAARKGRVHPGELHGMAKLTDAAVREIRGSTEYLYVLAQRYGVSISSVARVRRREAWVHVR
jgi:hypothetical protein